MSKILTVIKREYVQMVRSKGFIIGTILGPVLMAAIVLIPMLFSMISVERQENIAVVDESRMIYPGLESRLNMKLKDGSPRYRLEEIVPQGDMEGILSELNQKVLAKELSAYLYIPADVAEGETAEFVSLHVADFDKTRLIHEALNSVVIEKRLRGEGLDPEKISEFTRRIRLTTKKVTKQGAEEDRGGSFLIAYVLVLILYMTLLFYGSIIMRGVIEEKNSRMVEIVLSSLKPFQLMAGKILGIAAVGLTQYGIWALFGVGLSQYGGRFMAGVMPSAAGIRIPTIPIYIFVYFVLFFILGYFLYAALYAAIGSMVNSEKEAQQLMMPVTMFLVIPLLLMMYVIRSPESTLSVVLSLIPFFAPILMLLRVCILLPPAVQTAGSIALLLLSILLMIWIAAKIYRVGILMYGKRPKFGEVLKWMRYK